MKKTHACLLQDCSTSPACLEFRVEVGPICEKLGPVEGRYARIQ